MATTGIVVKILTAVRRLVMAQSKSRQRLEAQAVKAASVRTKAMTDEAWRDFDAVTRYAQDMVRVVEAPQRAVAAVTNAYQARLLTELTETTATPVKQIDVTTLRNVDHDVVYGRMADYYRYLTDNPDRQETPEKAAQLVVQRAEEVAQMDVALAVRAQNHEVVRTKKKVKYYRRVIHPELADSGASCGLCIVASDRIYTKDQLMPIHFRCHCEVVPVMKETDDYGFRLNEDDLEQLYKAAGGNEAKRLKETRFTIHQHGELGPVLSYQGNRWRGPSEVEDDTEHGKDLG